MRAEEYTTPWFDLDSLREALTSLDAVMQRAFTSERNSKLVGLLREMRLRNCSNQKPPVWVLSTGRCGTYAIYSLLARHDSVVPYHRRHFPLTNRNEVFFGLGTGRVSETWLEEAVFDYLTGQSMGYFLSALTRGRQFVSVDNHEVAWLPIIVALFPDAHFIHLVRNFRDVATSWLSKSIYSPEQIKPVQLPPSRFDQYLRMAFKSGPLNWSPVEELVWYWQSVNLYIEATLCRMPCENVGFIRSEDLYAARLHTYETLRDKIHLGTHEDFIGHFQVKHNEGSRRGRYADLSAGNWPRGWVEHRRKETEEQMQRYGYTLADAACLNGVP